MTKQHANHRVTWGVRTFIYAYCLFALFGCASNNSGYRDAPVADGSTATIYFYRPQKFLLGAYDARLTIDGTSALKLSGGSYSYIRVNEGCHHVQLTWPYYASLGEKADLDICVKANESSYVRMEGFNVVSWQLMQIARAIAVSEIGKSTYEPADEGSE
jgi:hypothetical protein